MEIVTADRQPSTFYVGFVANFEIVPTHEKKHSLQDASLSVFQDIAGDLAPLFGAEWHEKAALDERSKHAQPHWHFVQRPDRIERILRTHMRSGQTIEFAPERKSALLSGLADCGKFHFAMTSQWDEHDTPPYKNKIVFDSEEFPKWFAGLANYVAGQITYLVQKMPVRARAFERHRSWR